ncbi:MAG: flagellar basal body protein [Bryobacteraceae bacterium]|nr:flagellar basal body protein [Bryobacteraceae bacterium]
MDLLSTRQKLVASNIANANTPGYRTRDLDFHFEFMSHAEGGQPNIIEPEGLAGRNDGNNVSMDREARLLAENTMRFNFVSNILRGELKSIRTAIQEGGR